MLQNNEIIFVYKYYIEVNLVANLSHLSLMQSEYSPMYILNKKINKEIITIMTKQQQQQYK